MKLQQSKQMLMLVSFIFMAMSLAIISLPVAILAKCALILAFSYYIYQQLKQYVLLKNSTAIIDLDCDENHVWTLKSNNQITLTTHLSPKSFISAHWMCLNFQINKQQSPTRVYLSSDSLSKQDWSLLQLLVRFAKPMS